MKKIKRIRSTKDDKIIRDKFYRDVKEILKALKKRLAK